MARTITRYTTAPAEYDGFGTATVAEPGTLNRKPLRQVAIATEHLMWQEARYESGLHYAFTEEQFEELCKHHPWYTAHIE